eukprot:TRINITY_DN6213_c0_g1_i2.p1 TRINITY_DN6213_c0_g1~~TRINITY_DN6213_c0_g1_i2.p1  ORF type:complete len:3158 (+),score=468.32 TRINITY_DN6213_c0_g1_i2:1235-9475(+)
MHSPSGVRLIALHWLMQILSVPVQGNTVVSQLLLPQLIPISKDRDAPVRRLAITCIEKTLQLDLGTDCGKESVQSLWDKVMDIEESVWAPALAAISHFDTWELSILKNRSQCELAQTNTWPMRAGQLTALLAELKNCSLITKAVMQGPSPLVHFWHNMRCIYSETCPVWTIRNLESTKGKKKSNQGTGTHHIATWFVLQAARLIVVERLKSSIGGPSQTLEAIEAVLKSIASSSLMIDDNYEHLLNSNNSPLCLDDAILQGDQVLIHLLTELERQVFLAQEAFGYESYTPVATSLNSVVSNSYPVNAVAFFHTNRKVCDDYFSRLRIHLLAACERCNLGGTMSSTLIRNAICRLADLKAHLSHQDKKREDKSPLAFVATRVRIYFEMEKIMLALALALRKKRGSDNIEGFIPWCRGFHKQLFGTQPIPISAHGVVGCLEESTIRILRGISFLSRGMYEPALRCFKALYDTPAFRNIQFYSMTVLTQLTVECFTHTGDYLGFNKWLTVVQQLRLAAENEDEAEAPSAESLPFGDHRKKQRSLVSTYLLQDCFAPAVNPTSSTSTTALSVEYLKALSNFDATNYAGTQQYVNSALAKLSSQARSGTFLSNHTLLTKFAILGSLSQATLAYAPGNKAAQYSVTPVNLSQARENLRTVVAGIVDTSLSDSEPAEALTLLRILGIIERTPGFLSSDVLPDRNVLAQLTHFVHHPELFNGIRPAVGKTDLVIEACKAARRNSNFSKAEELLASLQQHPFVQYQRAKVLLARGDHEEAALRVLCSIAKLPLGDREVEQTRQKALLKIEQLVRTTEGSRSQSAEKALGAQAALTSTVRSPLLVPASCAPASRHLGTSFDICRWLLERAVTVNSEDRASLTAYGEWCVRQGSRIFARLDKSGSDAQMAMPVLIDVDSTAANGGTAQDASQLLTHAVMCFFRALQCASSSKATVVADIQLTLRIVRLIMEQTQRGSISLAPGMTEDMACDASALTGDDTLIRTVADGIRNSPAHVWRDITLQLLAQLSNELPAFRAVVLGLLRTIVQQRPHALVYPVVAGIHTKKGPVRQYKRLFDEMLEHSPNLVEGVQLVSSELLSITVLWEEEWLITMTSIANTLNKIFHSYRAFVKSKVDTIQDASIGAAAKNQMKLDKLQSLLNPLVSTLQAAVAAPIFNSPPQTLYEHNFQDTYSSCIRRLLYTLRTVPAELAMGTANFDAALAEHQSRAQEAVSALVRKFSTVHRKKDPNISLSHISPTLAELRDTCVPVPGTSGDILDGPAVTISRFDPYVELLASKTKPKKLTLTGSDGRKCTYLLKGKEDLHLDERIMQFLRVASTALQTAGERTRHLSARHYAVVPLADRSGLIRFVDGALALFHLHRSWVRRKAFREAQPPPGTKPNPAAPPAPQAVFRPVDQFFSKLIPALREAGITNVASRGDWPADVLKRVLKELMTETPKDLLARELWCRGTSISSPQGPGLNTWYQRVQTFSESAAVMSMIGYVLGLGDRHLDNILMDFDTGEVVHIDYNICFEKGQQLRVPEVVPFRMTPIMQTALGPQGTSGVFKNTCEAVLEVLRNRRFMLVMLLEAFVYDPLVEWTALKAEEDVHENMEVKVSLSLFVSRLDELWPAFQDRAGLTEAALKNLAEVVQCLTKTRPEEMESLRSAKAAETRLERCKKEISECDTAVKELQTELERLAVSKCETDYRHARTLILEEMKKYSSVQSQNCEFFEALLHPRGVFASQAAENWESLLQRLSKPRQPCLGQALQALGVPVPTALQEKEARILVLLQEQTQSLQWLFGSLREYQLAVTNIEQTLRERPYPCHTDLCLPLDKKVKQPPEYVRFGKCYFWERCFAACIEDRVDECAKRKPDEESIHEIIELVENVVAQLGVSAETDRRAKATKCLSVLMEEFCVIGNHYQELATAIMENSATDLQSQIAEERATLVTLAQTGGSKALLCACAFTLATQADSLLLWNNTDSEGLNISEPEFVLIPRSLVATPQADGIPSLLPTAWQTFSKFFTQCSALNVAVGLALPRLHANLDGDVRAATEACVASLSSVHVVTTAIPKMLQEFCRVFVGMLQKLQTPTSSAEGKYRRFLHEVGDIDNVGDPDLNLVQESGSAVEELHQSVLDWLRQITPVPDKLPHPSIMQHHLSSERAKLVRASIECALASVTPSAVPLRAHQACQNHLHLQRAVRLVHSHIDGVIRGLCVPALACLATRVLDAILELCCTESGLVLPDTSQFGVLSRLDHTTWVVEQCEAAMADSESVPQNFAQQLSTGRSLCDSLVRDTSVFDEQRRRSEILLYYRSTQYFELLLLPLRHEILQFAWLHSPELQPDDIAHHVAQIASRYDFVPEEQAQKLLEIVMWRKKLLTTLNHHLGTVNAVVASLREAEGAYTTAIQETLQTLPPQHFGHVKSTIEMRPQALLESDSTVSKVISLANETLRMELLRECSPENADVQAAVAKQLKGFSERLTTFTKTKLAVTRLQSTISGLSNSKRSAELSLPQLQRAVDEMNLKRSQLQKERHGDNGKLNEKRAFVAQEAKESARVIAEVLSLVDSVIKVSRHYAALHALHNRSKRLKDFLTKHIQWLNEVIVAPTGPSDDGLEEDEWQPREVKWHLQCSEANQHMIDELGNLSAICTEFTDGSQESKSSEEAEDDDAVEDGAEEDAQRDEIQPREERLRRGREQPKQSGRNAYAVNVLHRVLAKLEGADSELASEKALTVSQQVQSIIQQATALDNLSVMYEGWAPWI